MKIISQQQEITFDDILLLPNLSTFLSTEERNVIKLQTRLTNKIFLDIPIISAPMPGITESTMAIALAQAGGIGFIHQFQPFKRQLEEVEKVKKLKLKVAACVSDFSENGIAHVAKLLKIGADLISVETGHAHNTFTIAFIRKLKKQFKTIQISAALVVDAGGAEALIKAGADNIRVGIGGGSHCTTRLVTGVGRPQLSAVADCFKVTQKYNIPLISDTGIRYAGDILKAIVFGADAVMIGGLLAGTDECPGKIVTKEGKKYKYSWGMSTNMASEHGMLDLFSQTTIVKNFIQQLRNLIETSSRNKPKNFEEGTGGLMPYKGSVTTVLNELIQAVRRSMWYQGATTISELRNKARVVLVSSNTMAENVPRI